MNLKSIQIVDVTDVLGKVVEPDWLKKAQFVHRQLRPDLPNDYQAKMQRVFTGGGRMSIAVVEGEVAGVAVFRVYENTVTGIHMYVDDLVTDETQRSSGVGNALLGHMQAQAKRLDCNTFTLDSGTQRQQAHKFYFREGMTVIAFHFAKSLRSRP